jgi:hypothetical protein
MEKRIVTPATPATSTQVSKTLEEVLDNIRELYTQEQVAKCRQGEQVNLVEDAHLALREGYKKARECLKEQRPDLQTSTLYRHAFVAKHYSREDRKRWGVAKLQALAGIQTRAHGKPLPGDPADHEIHITREDGSVVAKKFSDCTWRELQSAARRQKQARKDAGRPVEEGANESGPVSKRSPPALPRALAMLGLGVLTGVIGNLRSPSAPGFWISVLSIVLVLAGTAELVRYFVAVRDRFFAAFKEQGMEVLKWAQSKSTTTTGEEASPPSERKAA